MRKLLLFTFLFFSYYGFGQDGLFDLIDDNDEPIYVTYLFKGTKVVNGQSVELPAQGVLQFNIQHRFGTLNSGLYNLYGLDFSQVRISFDYGVTDWSTITLGRSSSLKTIDGNSKIRIKRQVKNGFPFTIVFNSAVYIKQWQHFQISEDLFSFNNQFSYINQFLIARKISRDLTLQFSPTLLHYNLVTVKDESNDKYAIGFGGRQKITKRISLNAEYFYQLNNKINNNVLSFGFDIETGGHIFQLHISNSSAMIDTEFITKTNGKWLEGDVYFGFNISRVFTINT